MELITLAWACTVNVDFKILPRLHGGRQTRLNTININQCSMQESPCHPNATRIELIGSYNYCICNEVFQGDGVVKEQLDCFLRHNLALNSIIMVIKKLRQILLCNQISKIGMSLKPFYCPCCACCATSTTIAFSTVARVLILFKNLNH